MMGCIMLPTAGLVRCVNLIQDVNMNLFILVGAEPSRGVAFWLIGLSSVLPICYDLTAIIVEIRFHVASKTGSVLVSLIWRAWGLISASARCSVISNSSSSCFRGLFESELQIVVL